MNFFEKEVIDIGRLLIKTNKKIAIAESCTGGLVSYFLTSVDGSSKWFERAFVTYSNQSKIDLLNVKNDTIKKNGVVSGEVATEMAIGALKNSKADIAISITGIAGKPVNDFFCKSGDFFICINELNGKIALYSESFEGNRYKIRKKITEYTLRKLIKFLLN